MEIIKTSNNLEKKWVKVKGHDGYMVSNYGDVISYKNTSSSQLSDKPILLKQSVVTTHCNKKYNRVIIQGKQYYVHRLVGMHFLENVDNKPQINHIDNNSQNNVVTNLEWVTNSENQIHRFKMSGTTHNLGRYVHRNRNTFRVFKKGIIDKSFKDLKTAQEFAKNYYESRETAKYE